MVLKKESDLKSSMPTDKDKVPAVMTGEPDIRVLRSWIGV
jgi:hypothetical protein